MFCLTLKHFYNSHGLPLNKSGDGARATGEETVFGLR
jgi:hypothetical protein